MPREGEIFWIPPRISPSEVDEAKRFIEAIERVSQPPGRDVVLEWVTNLSKLVASRHSKEDIRDSIKALVEYLQPKFPRYVYTPESTDELIENGQRFLPLAAELVEHFGEIQVRVDGMRSNCQKLIDAAERFKAETEARRKEDDDRKDKREYHKVLATRLEQKYGKDATWIEILYKDPNAFKEALKGTKWEVKD